MRNLRPEKIDSRASKALDADSPQRLRACVEAVSHRQRRSTNPPRLKSSAGKGKPGQHNKQSTSHHPAFQQTNTLLAPTRNHGSKTVQNKEAPPHRGYLCSPTHQNRPKQPPTSRINHPASLEEQVYLKAMSPKADNINMDYGTGGDSDPDK